MQDTVAMPAPQKKPQPQDTVAMPAPLRYPRPAYAWYCLGVICFAYLFGFMDRIIVGLLTPAIEKDLGLTDAQMGVIQGFAFALFYTFFGLPIGWAADRTSRKWLLTGGTALWSLMTAGAGLVRSFGGLFVTRAGVGVGEATINPCTTSLVSDYFRPETRPKAFGVFTMSTAFGTIATYLGGGAVLAFVGLIGSGGGVFDMPLLGPIPAWQAVFIIIGVAGLVPALLMALTVREPPRRGFLATGRRANWSDTWRFLKPNLGTLACLYFGVAFIVGPIYGWVNWLPAYFVRIHDWSVPKFSVIYGIGAGLAGLFSALSSGYVTNALKARGFADGTMRTILIGGIGLILGTGFAPLLPTAALAMAGYVAAGLFVNYAPSQALAAIAEMTPNELRGFLTSIYTLVVGIAGAGMGPFAMGWVTTHLFADPMKIGQSMALVTFVMGITGIALVAIGLGAFRRSLSRVTWSVG